MTHQGILNFLLKLAANFKISMFRSDSDNSLSSEPTNQFLAGMSKLPQFNSGSADHAAPGLSDKDNNKNLLLAMLWLQRHREIMSLQQNETQTKQQQHQVSDFRASHVSPISVEILTQFPAAPLLYNVIFSCSKREQKSREVTELSSFSD